MVRPGVTTKELDEAAEEIIRSKGGIPAFKGYRDYPATLCTSINDQVVHGIPKARKLESGDIASIDVGVKYNGYYGDSAATIPVGAVDEAVQRLLQITVQALYQGIDRAQPGGRLSDISHAIQTWVEDNGFSVVRQFVGHGIGRALHEDPQIPNFGPPHRGPRLRPGMILAIEPMVNMGTYETAFAEDGWTTSTADGLPSAHFEHTVAIGRDGPEILTAIPEVSSLK